MAPKNPRTYCIVTGSRDFGVRSEHQVSDQDLLDAVLHRALQLATSTRSQLIIVHGGCKTGADTLAHRWAINNEVYVKVFPANWDRYGRRAGPIRNVEMVRTTVNEGS